MLNVLNPISTFRIDSGKGRLRSAFTTRSEPWSVGMRTFSYDEITPNPNSALGFYAKFRPGRFDFDLPYWFVVLLSAIFALPPWIRWSKRFSLRALLIVTTLVAVVLGMIAWLDRAGEVAEVTYRLHAPELADGSVVYITGSVPGLGDWQPDKVRMTAAGRHVWTYQLAARVGQTIEYKYTLGSWEREAAGADGRPLVNFSVTACGTTVQEDTVNFWMAGQRRELHGQVTGTVQYHRAMAGDGILPRDVIVWLPPGYDDAAATGTQGNESAARYPVLYMHDGQNIVDPATSSFGVDWEVDETCTRLIAEQKIPSLIVVAIYNTPDRKLEYLPGPKGTAYMEFILRQLKPFIDVHYRTESGRATTFVGGSSAGGLCAFMLAWEHSDVFGGAMCMSPAFRIETRDATKDSATKDVDDLAIDYVTTVQKGERPRQPTFFYIDIGGVGLEATLQPGVDAMLAALQAKGFAAGREFTYVRDPEARHLESAWAKRFPAALITLLGERDKADSTTQSAEK
jgi:predicted alpha/beta superfamily hydrolase